MTNTIGRSHLDIDLSAGDGIDLALQLETGVGLTPEGRIDHPTFFSGMLARPDVTAAGILAVADVATTTYLDLSALAATRDPVVTASGDRLRFESFSGCNGVHARYDLLSAGIDAGEVGFGTTNVDINPPLRDALAALPRTALMHLAVGPDALVVSTPEHTHEERQVDLPSRWVRGFAEVPVIMHAMTRVAEVPGTRAMAFLAGLPRTAPGPTVAVVQAARGLATTAPGTPGSATLAGTARLTSLRRVMRHIERLNVFGHPSGASAWVADLRGARMTLVLSPQPYRGFSGEGQLLDDLAGSDSPQDADQVLECLAWEPVIDQTWLSLETGLSERRVTSALAVLAASGKVGYDLSEGTWFHREIPFDVDAVERDHPRLRAARALVASGAVARTGDRWTVDDGGHRHWVTLGDTSPTCSCRWFVRYQGGRGHCSHILAALISSGQ